MITFMEFISHAIDFQSRLQCKHFFLSFEWMNTVLSLVASSKLFPQGQIYIPIFGCILKCNSYLHVLCFFLAFCANDSRVYDCHIQDHTWVGPFQANHSNAFAIPSWNWHGVLIFSFEFQWKIKRDWISDPICECVFAIQPDLKIKMNKSNEKLYAQCNSNRVSLANRSKRTILSQIYV